MNQKIPQEGISAKPLPEQLEDKSSKYSRIITNCPFFYGWVIIVAGTLGALMTTPGQTVGVSVFIDSIINDLKVSRSTVALMYALGTLAGSFLLTFVGRLIDHRGPRHAVIIIASLFALACVWMGFVNSPITLAIGFVLIRSLGQGSLSLVSLNVIHIWFVKRRSLAVGISSIGFALGVILFPPLIEFLISRFDWRSAYIILGCLVALTILPIGALFFRERPEVYGLQPDGKQESAPNYVLEENNFTLTQALRTLTFWLFSGGDFLVAAFGTGLLFHHYSIIAEVGVNRELATLIFVPLGIVSVGSNLLTGFLLSRVEPRWLLSIVLILLATSMAIATQTINLYSILIYGCLLGLMQGMKGVLSSSVYAHYFGRLHIGTIQGLVITISVAGTALGPYIFAFGLDEFGSYKPVLLISALAPLALAIVAPWLKLIQKSFTTSL
ncbi:MAG: MFS transporter [Symploca sp. SIO2B6]|nr:MFS transporter [Symploca sp. SIO2B6]